MTIFRNVISFSFLLEIKYFFFVLGDCIICWHQAFYLKRETNFGNLKLQSFRNILKSFYFLELAKAQNNKDT